MNTVTLWFEGNALTVSKVIADQFELQNHSIIESESLFWQVLRANASHNILICKQQLTPKN